MHPDLEGQSREVRLLVLIEATINVKTGEPGCVSTRILQARNPGADAARLALLIHSCCFVAENRSRCPVPDPRTPSLN